jgi:hypothetical protein
MPFTYKTANIKIPQIARWRIAGITDAKIAQMFGMSVAGIAAIIGTHEYQEYEAALMNGHLTAMDRALAGKVEAIHNECRIAVPAALRCLVEVVTQKRDLKAALAAAKEILDRDPDRTLVSSSDKEAIAPGVPAEVINAAAVEANKIAESYNKETPPKPN